MVLHRDGSHGITDGALVPQFHEDYIVTNGTMGSIYLKGHYGSRALILHDGTEFSERATPPGIATTVPRGLGDTDQFWHDLADGLVRDVPGQQAAPYPPLDQGALYQQITDLIRAGGTRADAPAT